jgi:putative nucleotidyltransferase with HDIG domain
MKKAGCSDERTAHSVQVADLALEIGEEMERQGIKVDKELIEKGALLHDIGYVRSTMQPIEIPEYKTIGLKIPAFYDLVRHQQVGAQMITEMGFSKPVALIALRHDAILLTNDERRKLRIEPVPDDDMITKTFEESAVLYADMLVFLRAVGLSPWSDMKLVRERFSPITRYVSVAAYDQTLQEKLMARIEERLHEARKYLRKEFVA